jgi:hypothetical protein
MKNLYTEQEIEFLKTKFPIFGAEYCAKYLNRTKCSIKTKTYSLGIKLNKRIDVEQFFNIKTKEIAYILGLLWADGHITFANNTAKTPIIKHTSKPSDNIIFLEILNKIGKWNSFTTKNIGSYAKEIKNISINWVSSRLIGEYLIQNQYRNKTESPSLILSKIPNNLKVYWFRGYFDGDGSVSIKNKGYHSIAFTGHEKQDWKFIVDLFNEIGIIDYRHRIIKSRDGKSSQIVISKKEELFKFENYLYFDYDINPLGLYRKRIQFKDL